MLIYLAALETQAQKQCFAALYEQHRYLMLHTAMRVLKNQALAEDAVHNAFVKIIDCMERFEGLPEENARALAVVIARNKAIDLYRQEQRRAAMPIEEEILDVEADASFSPARYMIEHEDYTTLTGLIARLGPTYQSTFELKYIGGYTDREIAQLLDTSLKNVQVRLYRGRKMLARLLREEVNRDV